jgi:hypothetical protein
VTQAYSPATGLSVDTLADQYLDRHQYRELVTRIRAIVRDRLPLEAKVLTISKGDTGLVRLDGRAAGHFPQNDYGMYAGHHPADSTSAITHLEALRARGAEFLIVPATAFWWFKHYKQFRRHLERRYPVLVRQEDTCVIFALQPDEHQPTAAGVGTGNANYQALVCEIRDVVESLLPAGATVAVISNGDDALIQLGERTAWHMPQEELGRYAGYHPADGAAAVAHIETMSASGAEFLIVPSTAVWWLTSYPELARHLATRGRLVIHQPHVCTIYALA